MTLEICSEGSCPIPLFLKGDAAGFALNAVRARGTAFARGLPLVDRRWIGCHAKHSCEAADATSSSIQPSTAPPGRTGAASAGA